MEKKGQLISWRKKAFLILLGIFIVMGFSANAQAQWKYGIGTGVGALAIEGDVGMNTAIVGPVKAGVDLDAGDVGDLIDTAFGFAGYATDGTYMVQYSFSSIQLAGDGSQGAVTVNADVDIVGGEITLAYPVYKDPSAVLSVLGGVRYTSHELQFEVTAPGPLFQTKELDNSWVDGVVGVTLDVPFADQWNWASRLDAAFGGSEGTYTASTGVTWRFYDHWSTTLAAMYRAVEFEDGNQADTDWYLYDIDEKSLSLGILYHF